MFFSWCSMPAAKVRWYAPQSPHHRGGSDSPGRSVEGNTLTGSHGFPGRFGESWKSLGSISVVCGDLWYGLCEKRWKLDKTWREEGCSYYGISSLVESFSALFSWACTFHKHMPSLACWLPKVRALPHKILPRSRAFLQNLAEVPDRN